MAALIKHKKIVNRFIICSLLVIAALIPFLIRQYKVLSLRSHFTYSDPESQYKQGLPVHSMDLGKYDCYFLQAYALIEYNYIEAVELPIPLSYYNVSGEDAEASLVYPKGTKVIVWPNGTNEPPVGYGCVCYPDYQKGWRYGKPFLIVDQEGAAVEKSYYVRTRDLEAVASEFFRINPKLQLPIKSGSSRKQQTYHLIRRIDEIFYGKGVFCSLDLDDFV